MLTNPESKYRPFPPVALKKRQWPDVTLTKAPIWCSVDLRDGNQALINPMGTAKKLELFKVLVEIGFKEIEVGFPAASDTDFSFTRKLIEDNLIPDDVSIQVLTQAREPLIKRTFEAIDGAKSAIVHLYNSTSTLQRRVVFRADKPEITKIAVTGAELIKDLIPSVPNTDVALQYSPESFTGTEMDYAAEICDAVCDVWQPTEARKTIINLPSTVELAMPNVYADQLEEFQQLFKHRAQSIISLHTHNDRGTGVAATELGLLAGGDRVEGTLFGNGERTGNLDLVTVALNLYTQGINPELDFSDIRKVRALCEDVTELPVHERHPYAGDLAFTAFSGSHQDAIKKGFDASKESESGLFEVPYITIDPEDIGRQYDPIIRVNSQSGKGGVAFLVQEEMGFRLPRMLQIEFSKHVQGITDTSEQEITSKALIEEFSKEYLEPASALTYQSHFNESAEAGDDSGEETYRFNITYKGESQTVKGSGNGPLSAFVAAINSELGLRFDVLGYEEHAIELGADANAAAYVRVKDGEGVEWWGVGKALSITRAPIYALIAAINRSLSK